MTILRSCCSQCGKGELGQRAEKSLGQLNLVFTLPSGGWKTTTPVPYSSISKPCPPGLQHQRAGRVLCTTGTIKAHNAVTVYPQCLC